jgi:hypothetical protein
MSEPVPASRIQCQPSHQRKLGSMGSGQGWFVRVFGPKIGWAGECNNNVSITRSKTDGQSPIGQENEINVCMCQTFEEFVQDRNSTAVPGVRRQIWLTASLGVVYSGPPNGEGGQRRSSPSNSLPCLYRGRFPLNRLNSRWPIYGPSCVVIPGLRWLQNVHIITIIKYEHAYIKALGMPFHFLKRIKCLWICLECCFDCPNFRTDLERTQFLIWP